MARGDHIYVYAVGYSHHGIDCGDGYVIHFNSGPLQKLMGQSLVRPAFIEQVPLATFTQGRSVQVRRYDVCDDVETTLQRAVSRVGDSNYELFQNNCEHFAVWCKTGWPRSTQVDAVRGAAKGASKTVAAALAVAKLSRRLPTRARVAIYGTALAVTAGAFTIEYVKERLNQQSRGES